MKSENKFLTLTFFLEKKVLVFIFNFVISLLSQWTQNFNVKVKFE